MKTLFALLLIWCILTIQLGMDNAVYQETADFELQHRAFIVYTSTLRGCMESGGMTYDQCKNMAYNEKGLYLETGK